MADFVVLATADWDHPLWTNKQHVASALADLGHRVLYVDSLGVRGPRVDRSDMGRILRRLRRGLRLPRKVRSGVWVISPLVLPGKVLGFSGLLNRWSLGFSLFVADLVLDLHHPLLWTFNPQTQSYLSLSRFQAVVYLCVDRIQSQPGMPVALLEVAERKLCAAANALFTTSPQLHAVLGPLNAGSHQFGNVADAAHFGQALADDLPRPCDWPESNGPVLIFIGAIDAYKLDMKMLELLMERTPHWTYLFIGPVGETDPTTDVSGWRRMANVHLLGTRGYRALPAYLAHSDVALLPLQLNDYTRNMYPMKFFEYLAAGRSVVATAIPALHDQRDVALLCEPEVSEFEVAIGRALAGEGPSLQLRLDRANKHTYFTRTKAMLNCLSDRGLMPFEPLSPQDPGFCQLRINASCDHLFAQFCTAGLRVLDVIFGLRASQYLLQYWLSKEPVNLVLLNDMFRRSLVAVDNKGACLLIERIWKEDGVADSLNNLLFRFFYSSPSGIKELSCFEEFASSAILPLYYTGYCRVASIYCAIDVHDPVSLRRGIRELDVLLNSLELDPDTYHCLRTNFKNRSGLLISAQLARLLALIALKDLRRLSSCSIQLLTSVSHYDPFIVDRATAKRMIRPMMRSLTIAAVMAWSGEDAALFDAVVAQMERLRDACFSEQFNFIVGKTSEDHRAFADSLVSMLKACRWPSEQPEKRPDQASLVDPILLVYFSDIRRESADQALHFLQLLRGQ